MNVLIYNPDAMTKNTVIPLGRACECRATRLDFSVASWLARFPGGSIALYIKDPNGETYLADIRLGDDVASWVIRESDTQVPGFGSLELALIGPDGEKKLSAVATTRLDVSLVESGDAPDHAQPWLEHAAEMQADTEAAARAAATHAAAAAASADQAARSAEVSAQSVKTSVDAWLDSHPEATTTVQDNSLTEDKLTDELRMQVSNRDYRAVRPSFGWIDDDGKVYVYQYLYPWAVEHNVPFMSALITQLIETGRTGWLTVEQVKKMYAEHPEIISYGSHTRDHVNASSMLEDDMDNQYGGSKADIERWGAPCDVMVYPNGQVNDTTLPIVRKYYKYGVQASGDGGDPGNRVNYSPIGTYTLKRRSLGMNSDLEKIKAEIDITIETNGLLIFMTHVNAYDSGNTDIDAELAKYTQVVEYLRSKGYDFEPVSVILERFRNFAEVGNWSRDGAPRDYFVIGADGTVGVGKMSGHVVSRQDKYNNASLPSEYPQNQVTTTHVTNDPNLPVSAGVLTAYVCGQHGYRTFMPSSANTLYTQIKKPDGDVWNSWVDVTRGYVNLESNNKVHGGTTPQDCPSRISICLVSTASLTAELPEAKTGVLTTYKISTTAANTWQEWKPLSSVVKYIRRAKSNTAWNPWYKFEPVLVE